MTGLRVLIVEDEALVALEVEALLTDLGCDVVAAVDSVTDAVAVANAHPVDLALLDVNLGPGGSGIDIARALSARGIHCLFVSGNCPADGRDLALGCVGKPFAESTLAGSVRLVAAMKQGAEPPPPPPGLRLFA